MIQPCFSFYERKDDFGLGASLLEFPPHAGGALSLRPDSTAKKTGGSCD